MVLLLAICSMGQGLPEVATGGGQNHESLLSSSASRNRSSSGCAESTEDGGSDIRQS